MKGKSLSNPAKKAVKHRNSSWMSKADRKDAKRGVKTGNGKGAQGKRQFTNKPLRSLDVFKQGHSATVSRRISKQHGVAGGLRTLAARDYMGLSTKYGEY